MKLTTGAIDGQQWEWFYRWGPLTLFYLLIFSDCFSLVLHLARVSVTTGSMRRYLDPIDVAQAVQLLQRGTSIRAIARRFAVSPSTVSRAWRRFQETGSHSRRADQGRRRSLTHQHHHKLTPRKQLANFSAIARIRSHEWEHPCNLIRVRKKKGPAPFLKRCISIWVIQNEWLKSHLTDIACDLHRNAAQYRSAKCELRINVFFFFNDWDRTPIAVRGRQQYGSEGIVIDELKPFRQDKRWVQNNCCSLKRLYYRDLSLQGFESNQFQHRRGQVWEGNLIWPHGFFFFYGNLSG